MEVWIRQGMAYRPRKDAPTPFPVPGWMWDRSLGVDLYDQRIRYMRRIDQLGFDGLIFTEHHYGPNGGLTPSPNIMLSAATQVTDQIKLVTMGIILPLHAHPVRVAEELAMLDNLSHGRVVAGFVSGNAQAHYAYSLPPLEGRARHLEAYDLVVKAWTEEAPFEWHGEFYDYDCVSIVPRPLQQPYPPVWTAAAAAETLEWAARNHVGLLSSGPTERAKQTLDYYTHYAEQECGWTPTQLDRGLARELFIAPTMAEVRTVVEEVIARDRADAYAETFEAPNLQELERIKYTAHSYEYLGGRREDRREGRRNLDQMMTQGVYLLGDPDSIIQQIAQQKQMCDASVLVVRPEMGHLSLDHVGDMMELFAREVLPEVHRL